MENKLNQKLEKLKSEREELMPIAQISFKTKEEGKKYIEKNKEKLQRLNDVEEQIELLEWELKTPEEKEQYLKEEEISKLKRQNKL